jgi:hypothetical protein
MHSDAASWAVAGDKPRRRRREPFVSYCHPYEFDTAEFQGSSWTFR